MTTVERTQVFLLPDLGEGLSEAEIVEWQVAVGDTVTVDQTVVAVETAKAVVDVPCPYAGRVVALHGAAGETRPVGQPLITIAPVDGAGGDEPAGHATYREEERAGSGNVLIGYGTGHGATGRRRRRSRLAVAPEPSAGTSTPAAAPIAAAPPAPAAPAAPGSTRAVAPVPASAPVPPPVPAPPPALAQASASASAPALALAQASAPALGSALAPAPAPALGSASVLAPAPVRTSASGTVSGSARSPEAAPAGPPESRTGPALVISPIVRRLAREHGIDPATLHGTGPGGVVRRADVEAAVAVPALRLASVPQRPEPAPAAAPTGDGDGDVVIPLTGIRKVIADKLSRSRREIPEVTIWVDADATALLETRRAINAATPDQPVSVLALMARICLSGLRRFPQLNARVDSENQRIVQSRGVHLGIAAQTDRGLVVPVLRDAQLLTTRELAGALTETTAAARAGALPPARLTGGTFTLNNYGVFGVDGSTPIINHPEAALLGIGRIVDKPWVVDGQLAVRKVTQLSLTFDHRVCDGGVAGGFLRHVADCVEQPALLVAHV